MSGSHVITPCRRIDGSIKAPGDKSISHRALLVAGLAEGRTTIEGLSPAQDVLASAAALAALGVAVDIRGRGPTHHRSQPQHYLEGDIPSTPSRGFQGLVESPGVGRLRSPAWDLNVGNSGTTIRLLAGILAGSSATATLTGDDSIRRRPMARVVTPLRAMGAHITGVDDGRFAPLRVEGTKLHGARHELEVASAQVKSALLLAGLSASGETEVIEPGFSRDHTERMLRYLGAPINVSRNRSIVKSTKLQGAELSVPGDLSSAAFLLVAAAILPGSHVRIEDVGLNPTRSGILDILRAYGATVAVEGQRVVCEEPVGTVSVRAADRRPIGVAGDVAITAIDELPLVAVLGACAEGETVLRDASELRVKESDRIDAVVEAVASMGADITGTPDGFVVRGPAKLTGATIDPRGDHRIAMTAAVAALVAESPTTILDWACVGVSYPGFERDLERVAVR